jgi:lambda repressor-like predicted transcriptional regulator
VIRALAARGLTLAALARSAKCVPSDFAHVQRQIRAKRQAQIAAAIGLSPLAIWPSRYEPETGRPLTHSEWESATNSGEPSCTTEQSPAAVGSSS